MIEGRCCADRDASAAACLCESYDETPAGVFVSDWRRFFAVFDQYKNYVINELKELCDCNEADPNQRAIIPPMSARNCIAWNIRKHPFES